MSVGGLQFFVLEKRRGRQDDISVIGSVRQELLVDHREQVLARKASHHTVVIGCDRNWVGVVNEDCL